jgi:hypothetical protein
LGRVAYNCEEETARDEAVIIYYDDGTNERFLPDVIAAKSWEPVPPESVQSFELQYICAWKKK